MSLFRNYTELSNNDITKVSKTYKDMLENHTIKYAISMNDKYTNGPYQNLDIWKVINLLDDIVDESDPDNDLPQIVHSYQTGESILNRYFNDIGEFKNNYIKCLFTNEEWNNLPEIYQDEYDTTLNNYYKHIEDWSWFPLIGFIHDLGKVMLLREWGSLPQWAVVGDTFPVGIELSESYIMFESMYHNNNDSINGNMNIYTENCGFNKVIFNWSHDEYIASFTERNGFGFPLEAIYILRYHSFYSWHTPRNLERGYTNLANIKDWKMLPLLKAFQKADLYSKMRTIPNINEIKYKYDDLIKKYFKSSNNQLLLKW
jgi:inositol oxygenase